MLVTLNVVEHENGTVTWWKLLDSTFKIHPVYGSRKPQVGSSDIFTGSPGIFVRLGGLLQGAHRKCLLPKTHQHHIDSRAVQPGGKRRLTPKSRDFPKKL